MESNLFACGRGSSSTPLTVKAHLLGTDEKVKEIRRFLVEDGAFCTFARLSTKTAAVLMLDSSCFSMFYRDEPGDLVAFSSTDELLMALAYVKDNTFNLFVKEIKEDRQDFPAVAAGSPSHHGPPGPVFHPGIYCNGCHGPVVGTRFKCSICFDYDLCSSCQRLGRHTEHPLLPIQRPLEDFPAVAAGSPSHHGPPGPVFHPGIYCNGCHGPVVGTRFKCSICFDYDLCSSCQRLGRHTKHPLLPIQRPR